MYQSPSFFLRRIKDLNTFENSLKIARPFRRVQFEKIFKYNEECTSLIARSFIRLNAYYMTEKFTNVSALIFTAVQSKVNENWPALSQSQGSNFSVI